MICPLVGVCLSRHVYKRQPSFFFLMVRRPPISTLSSSSAASDVYKRQNIHFLRAQDFVSCSETDQEHLDAQAHKIFADAVYKKTDEILKARFIKAAC